MGVQNIQDMFSRMPTCKNFKSIQLILEFQKYNLMEDLSKTLSKFLPHIKVTQNFIWVSTQLDSSEAYGEY
jgi:hypothetical protein